MPGKVLLRRLWLIYWIYIVLEYVSIRDRLPTVKSRQNNYANFGTTSNILVYGQYRTFDLYLNDSISSVKKHVKMFIHVFNVTYLTQYLTQYYSRKHFVLIVTLIHIVIRFTSRNLDELLRRCIIFYHLISIIYGIVKVD